jgi:hypothetical protein
MNSKQKSIIVKRSVGFVAGTVVGSIINQAIDNKLAKSKNPGFINRSYRKMLKVSRSPWYILGHALCCAAATALQVQLHADETGYDDNAGWAE